jgi:hypothetical protein
VCPSFALIHAGECCPIEPTTCWAMHVECHSRSWIMLNQSWLKADLSISLLYRYVGLLEVWWNHIMGYVWETLCHEYIMLIKLDYPRNLFLLIPGQMSSHAFCVRGIYFSYIYDLYIGFWNWEWPYASTNKNMKTVLCMIPSIWLDKKGHISYHYIFMT